jgi:hypothetical protein
MVSRIKMFCLEIALHLNSLDEDDKNIVLKFLDLTIRDFKAKKHTLLKFIT